MDWVTQRPPLTLAEKDCPACPYDGFLPIFSEADAEKAVQDQTDKLDPEVDRKLLQPLYRLLLLLNDRERHKTFQAYFGYSGERRDSADCFYSEILLNPFHPESSQFIIDLEAVQVLASEFVHRVETEATQSGPPRNTCITLTPIPTKFGKPPHPLWGYSLRLKTKASAHSRDAAIESWANSISMLVRVFDPAPRI